MKVKSHAHEVLLEMSIEIDPDHAVIDVRIHVYVHGVSGLAPAIWYPHALLCVRWGLA